MAALAETACHNMHMFKRGQKCIVGTRMVPIAKTITNCFLLRHCFNWSEWRDSNSRPPAPEAGALPGCATLRLFHNSAFIMPEKADFKP
jgi:hypothetical protein